MKYIKKAKYSKPYTARDALGIALQKEIDSYKFYNQLLKDKKNFSLVSTLRKLRDSEKAHIRGIRRMLDNEKCNAEIQIRRIMKYETKEKYSKPKGAEEALNLALVREKSAFDFYSHFCKQLIGNTESLPLLVVLRKLSCVEKSHIQVIEQMLKNL